MTVKILEPGSLQTERLPDGRRVLLRNFAVMLDEEIFRVPVGFVTDYSSWPRWLPGPSWDRIDLAGVIHDYVFRLGRSNPQGRPIGFHEANRIWYEVARSGQSHASWLGAWAGRIGLTLAAWPTWWKYRRAAR